VAKGMVRVLQDGEGAESVPMKIGEFEFPDKCPKDCLYTGDIGRHGQNSICGRCPVFTSTGNDPLVLPEEYRLDWAKEWAEFFKTGKEPELYF